MRAIYGPTNTEPQQVINRDIVETTADGVMLVRPTTDGEHIKRTLQNIDDWKRAAIELAMTNLRQECGELLPNESLMAREMVTIHLQRIPDTFIIGWGLTVSRPRLFPLAIPLAIYGFHFRQVAELHVS